MERMSIVLARDHLGEAVNKVAFGGGQVMIERHGKPAAVLIPVAEWELLERVIAEREDAADLLAAREAIKERGGVPLEQVKRELGIVTKSKPRAPRKKSA